MFSDYERFAPPGPDVEARIDGLIERMTLPEKIDLLGMQGSTIRGAESIGLPPLICSDGPLGVTRSLAFDERKVGATAYPASIALAAAWDEELAYEYGASIGRDARARGVHIVLGPGCNIYRSPLCGRNAEYMGEDPWLAGRTVAAYVRGCQDQGVGVTVKHYAMNCQEFDRYFVGSDADERTMREVYLPAFRAAVQEGGACGFMCAYNRVNGTYCSENNHLLNEILKDEWGMDGFVMSDAVSTHHGPAAANGGLDLELPEGEFMNRRHLLPAMFTGEVAEDTIDDKVRRILRTAVCFGWFDHEQKDDSIALENEQSARVALQTARQGTVLLRNEDGFLPLAGDDLRKVAVIGPASDPANTGAGGSSYVKPWREVSVLDGVRAAIGEEKVLHARGCDPWRFEQAYANSAFRTPDGEPGLLGRYFNDRNLRGEPVVERVDGPMNLFWMRKAPAEGVEKDCYGIRWTGYLTPEQDGEHVFYISGGDGEYRVWIGGELLISNWGQGHQGAKRPRMELQAGADYEVRIEYRPVWRYNWFQFGWEHESAVWPHREEALRIAAEADAVVYCTGHSRFSEGENSDRTFAMPPEAEALLLDVLEANPNTAVVLNGGGNIDMRRWLDRTRAVLHAWYPGQEGGTAVADILFGKVNPSGKLPATFERAWEDRSSFGCYHDADGDKRVFFADGVFGGYRHVDRYGIEPAFPFGFGLSYTTFEYENLRLSAESIERGQELRVQFDVVNTGDRAGAEVAQLYVHDRQASVGRPVKELKSYERVELDPGERATVQITLAEDALSFWHPERGEWMAEPGEFEVRIGASSRDIRLRGAFALIG